MPVESVRARRADASTRGGEAPARLPRTQLARGEDLDPALRAARSELAALTLRARDAEQRAVAAEGAVAGADDGRARREAQLSALEEEVAVHGRRRDTSVDEARRQAVATVEAARLEGQMLVADARAELGQHLMDLPTAAPSWPAAPVSATTSSVPLAAPPVVDSPLPIPPQDAAFVPSPAPSLPPPAPPVPPVVEAPTPSYPPPAPPAPPVVEAPAPAGAAASPAPATPTQAASPTEAAAPLPGGYSTVFVQGPDGSLRPMVLFTGAAGPASGEASPPQRTAPVVPTAPAMGHPGFAPYTDPYAAAAPHYPQQAPYAAAPAPQPALHYPQHAPYAAPPAPQYAPAPPVPSPIDVGSPTSPRSTGRRLMHLDVLLPLLAVAIVLIVLLAWLG